jgi:Conjugative transposon protein TcpC
VRAHPLWRLRFTRELPRYIVLALGGFGVLASARFAIAPPKPASGAVSAVPAPVADRSAEGFAALFARRYLTWDAAEPARDQQQLEPFAGSQLEPAAGFLPPATGAQRVEWAEVVGSREAAPGQTVYTVAAETRPVGLLYLTVGVTRTQAGNLALTGYPALVGPPASQASISSPVLRPIEDPGLQLVVKRALTNYLAGAGTDLAADLTSGAAVSAPTLPLELESISREGWAPAGGSVVATVQAEEERGARYTLTYELDVTRAQGRWEVSAIQTDPDA